MVVHVTLLMCLVKAHATVGHLFVSFTALLWHCLIVWHSRCRGNKFVECPYTGARFQPQCTGELSPVGNVAKIGADVSGLMCSPVQVR